MSDDKTGGPAFPHGYVNHGREQTLPSVGMSLRDWFAGMALQGYLAAPGDTGEVARNNPAIASEWSWAQADALLAAKKDKT